MKSSPCYRRPLIRRILGYIWIRLSLIVPNDKLYLRVLYRILVGEKLDLKNPRTFGQKLQFMKLYNKAPICTQMVDKYHVREFVRERIGDKYLVPCYGVYNSFDEIDFNLLPNSFVLKTTHDSGGIVICKDKSRFDPKKARRKIMKSLKRNYFLVGREYPYKNVPHKIIAEKFMCNSDGSDIVDYKFFCFNGIPQILFYASDRFNPDNLPAKFDFYDMNLRHLDIRSVGHANASQYLKKFDEFETMKSIAAELSAGFPHLRVDLYLINHQIYFGELTFHHDGGFVPFIPVEWNYKLGDMLILPNNHDN